MLDVTKLPSYFSSLHTETVFLKFFTRPNHHLSEHRLWIARRFPSAAANVRIKGEVKVGCRSSKQISKGPMSVWCFVPAACLFKGGQHLAVRRRQCSSTWFFLLAFYEMHLYSVMSPTQQPCGSNPLYSVIKAPRQMMLSQNIQFNYISLTMQLMWLLFKAAWHQMSTTEVIQINSHFNIEQIFLNVFGRCRLTSFSAWRIFLML